MADQPPTHVEPVRYVSEEQERLRILAEVLRDQSERIDAALQKEERRWKRARMRRGAMLATWVGVAYVWLATPSWLTIQPPPAPTVGEEAQSLRVNVFLQSQAIEAYRARQGRLPFVLQEAGPPFRGMEYRRRDSRSYELQGRTDRVIMRYNSEQPALDFVGGAADRLLRTTATDAGEDR